jgi:hypothetical protein
VPGSKPLVNPFEGTSESVDHYMASCIRVAGYQHYRLPHIVYKCEACTDPLNTASIRGHGFTEDLPYYVNCISCKKSLLRTRPILSCSSCINAREHILGRLRDHGIIRKNIRSLTYDVLNNDLIHILYWKPPTYELLQGENLDEIRRNNRPW